MEVHDCELQGGYMWDWVGIKISQQKIYTILFYFLLTVDLQFTWQHPNASLTHTSAISSVSTRTGVLNYCLSDIKTPDKCNRATQAVTIVTTKQSQCFILKLCWSGFSFRHKKQDESHAGRAQFLVSRTEICDLSCTLLWIASMKVDGVGFFDIWSS